MTLTNDQWASAVDCLDVDTVPVAMQVAGIDFGQVAEALCDDWQPRAKPTRLARLQAEHCAVDDHECRTAIAWLLENGGPMLRGGRLAGKPSKPSGCQCQH